LTHVDAEFEEFSTDPGSAPQRVCQAHGADQLADFERNFWSAATGSRLPSPEQAKTSTMPTDNRLRLHYHQGIRNAWRNPIEAGKNQTVEIAEGEPLQGFSSQHIELVAQGQNLRLERRRDQNNPMTAHQISLRMSPIGASIARFAAIRQLDRVYGSDSSFQENAEAPAV